MGVLGLTTALAVVVATDTDGDNRHPYYGMPMSGPVRWPEQVQRRVPGRARREALVRVRGHRGMNAVSVLCILNAPVPRVAHSIWRANSRCSELAIVARLPDL